MENFDDSCVVQIVLWNVIIIWWHFGELEMYPRILVAMNNVLIGSALGTDDAQLRKCILDGVLCSNLINASIFLIFNVYILLTRGIVTPRGILAFGRSFGFCCALSILRKQSAGLKMVSKSNVNDLTI